MLFRRVVANFVDIFLFIAIIVAMFMWVLPFFVPIPEGEYMSIPWAILALVGIAGFYLTLQWAFYMNNQTVGKAMMRLRIISKNDARPLTPTIIIQREIFAKVFTVGFMCIPVIWGGDGYHDIACETEVERY
jgi:uncharacterized RDD family membrane protein YckC